jgi:preprotein translocase subunit SecF
MIDLIGKRYYFFIFSLAIIIPGMILMAIWGVPLSIDFKGGSLLEAQFASGHYPQPADVIQLYNSIGIANTEVFTSGNDILIIRSEVLDDATRAKVVSAIESKFNDKVIVNRFDSVGPSVSQQVTQRAIIALVLASIALLVFITIQFRGVQHAVRYGVTTVIALIHDLGVIITVVVIGGHFFGWDVDTLYLTAVLTVVAFSAQDTIVVFDRMRENSAIFRRLDYEKLTNHSVVQSLTRSINTQLMTVDFMLLALALFGGVTLREFAIVLLVGMLSGSYSSDFVAAPLLVVWEKKEWRNWFGRNKSEAAA